VDAADKFRFAFTADLRGRLMRIAIVIGLAVLAAACSEEKEEPVCCAIEPQHQCRSDLLNGGVTVEELEIILGPDRVICPSDKLSAERMAELEPVWAKSAPCRSVGDVGRLSAMRSGLCDTKGIADLEYAPPPPGVTEKQVADCGAGLVARGLKENEIWLMLQAPDGICPNNGVSAERLREIIANDWAQAGCLQFTNAKMLEAMDTDRCGGDAG
jgi:hypothetical protein